MSRSFDGSILSEKTGRDTLQKDECWVNLRVRLYTPYPFPKRGVDYGPKNCTFFSALGFLGFFPLGFRVYAKEINNKIRVSLGFDRVCVQFYSCDDFFKFLKKAGKWCELQSFHDMCKGGLQGVHEVSLQGRKMSLKTNPMDSKTSIDSIIQNSSA